jgi:uncharacterized membrane protein YidH (DUF202 family)
MQPEALTDAELALAQQLAAAQSPGPLAAGAAGSLSPSDPSQQSSSAPCATGATTTTTATAPAEVVSEREVGGGTSPVVGTTPAVQGGPTGAGAGSVDGRGVSHLPADTASLSRSASTVGRAAALAATSTSSGAPPVSSPRGPPSSSLAKHASVKDMPTGTKDHVAIAVEGSAVRSRCLPARTKRSDAGGGPPGAHKRMVPVKIEPKTFFANERTFIQWLGAAVLLVTLSVAMTSLGSPETRRNARPAAIVFSVVSLVFLAYALYLFLWRDTMIRRKSAGPYNDRKGPVVLVLVLAAAMIATLVFMTTSSAGFVAVNWRDYSPGITIRAGTCDLLGAVGLSTGAAAAQSVALAPLFTPTSLELHVGMGSWLVATPYKLATVAAATDGAVDPYSAVSYLPIPGLNVQSIALASPTSTVVYLGTDNGEVVGFDLATSTLRRTWDLTSVLQGTEALLWGMAFVPSASDPEGGTFWVTDSSRLCEVGSVAYAGAWRWCVCVLGVGGGG